MLVNYMECIVEELYHEMIKCFPEYCACDLCKEDAICLALNKLPPLYNTTSEGHAYARLRELQTQFKVEAMQVVANAIQQVGRHPRHDTM